MTVKHEAASGSCDSLTPKTPEGKDASVRVAVGTSMRLGGTKLG